MENNDAKTETYALIAEASCKLLLDKGKFHIETLERFSRNLNKAFEVHGASVIKVASFCQVSRAVVYQWRRGDTWPSHVNINKLSDFFEVTPDYWLRDPDHPFRITPKEALGALAEWLGKDPKKRSISCG